MESMAAGDQVRPLLVSSDVELLDDLLRLGAAAGVELAVVPDVVAARSFWTTAPVVLVADDAARSASGALARARLPRRANVVLVTAETGDDVWRRAVAIGADLVCVLPDAETVLLDLLGRCCELTARPAAMIAVVGGRGGAGASTLAAALAVTAARAGDRVTFIDADPLSGGADLLFAGENAAGARWPDLADAHGLLPPRALREALPQVAELAVLSWDRPAWDKPAGDPWSRDGRARPDKPAGARGDAVFDIGSDVMASVLDAAGRGSDLVVADLPRQVGDTVRVVLGATDLVLVVVPAEVRAAAAALRVAEAIAPFASDARLVVRGPAPGGLRAAEIAAAVGLPLAGELRAEPDLAACLERGEAPAGRGVGPLARLCERLLEQLPARIDGPAEARWPA